MILRKWKIRKKKPRLCSALFINLFVLYSSTVCLLCLSTGVITAWMCVFHSFYPMRSSHLLYALICAGPCIQTYRSSLLWSTVACLKFVSLQHIHRFGRFGRFVASTHTVFESFGSQCVSSVCCMTSFVFLVVEASRNAAGKITNFSHQKVDRSAR